MFNEATRGKQPLVLIADDDLVALAVFEDALRDAGFGVITASDGEAALEEFHRFQPDMLLLDLVMPGKDGIEICRELRALPEGTNVPVVMITSADEVEVIHAAFDAGATDFLSKPVKPELLVYRLRCLHRTSLNLKRLADSEEKLARAQQIAHLGTFEWNPATGSFWMSSELSRILSMECCGNPSNLENFLSAVYPPDRAIVRASLARAFTEGCACDFEHRIGREGKKPRLVSLHGRPEISPSGKTRHLAGTLQDITDLREMQDRKNMLKEAIDSLPIGITLADPEGTIVYLNPAGARMHGYEVEELLGRDSSVLTGRERRSIARRDNLKGSGVWRRESVSIRKDGSEFPVQLASIRVVDHADRRLGIVTTCEDMSDKKEAEEKIRLLSCFDTLTGLPNRGMFLDRLHHALDQARRDDDRVGLLFLDLENFRDVNEAMGHDLGDKLLREVSARLAGCMSENDTLARLGGDEFVVVLTSVKDQQRAVNAAERILHSFTSPFHIEGRKIYTSASIGVAFYPDDCNDASTLFRCADTAMYHAKNEGRSQYRFFSSEMKQKLLRRVALENSLRQGLERDEFFLHYQPQWDLRTFQVVGVEALLRWQSEEFGLVSPAEFVPLTEDSGLILKVGEWVLRTACQQTKSWVQAGHSDLRVAINVSGRQLKEPSFLEMLTRVVRETGVNPKNLELELTESVIMEHADRTINTLETITAMGIQLSIDDFGTGYSSLNYLKHFPLDRIKIDRSFVAGLSSNRDDATIIEAIVSMASSLDLKVVAEGVETVEQVTQLIALGCDEVQGFYLAKPMTAEVMGKVLEGLKGKIINASTWTPWYNDRLDILVNT